MIKIRKEYKEKAIVWQGVKYDFRAISQEKIERIWKNNPTMAHFFEEDAEKEFFAQKPEHVTEEEFFEESIKKAVKKPIKKK